MSLLMKLNYILTQQPALENSLEQILLLLSKDIIQGELSKIWIISNDDYFITIYNDKHIQININDNMGKTVLMKIISFIIKKEKKKRQYPFFFIVRQENINIRNILWNNSKTQLKNNFKLFTFMMQSFIIVNQHQYENYFQ